MNFDTIDALEIPQGATELTTSELKQISGGWCPEQKKEKKMKVKCKQEEKQEKCKDNNN